MLSLRFVPLTAVGFIAASTMAQAAPSTYHHVMPVHRFNLQQSRISIPPRTESYAPSALWPSCMQGPPLCTAAGYPNLNYQRQIGNAR
jgi:hypothetical protein